MFIIDTDEKIKKHPIDRLRILFFLFLGVFHFRNLTFFDPYWGYDGGPHLHLVDYYLRHKTLPPPEVGYGSTNPPLYYVLSAMVLGIFGTFKAVQIFSFLLSLLNVIILDRLLELFSPRKSLNLALVATFAFLPPTLNYSYMVLNYDLSNFVAISAALLFLLMIFKKRLNWPYFLGLGSWLAMGILSATSGLAAAVSVLFSSLWIPRVSVLKRASFFLILALSMIAFVYPYSKAKETQQGVCFLCTYNRVPTNQNLLEIYPLDFYYRFPISAFQEPFAEYHLYDGSLWLLLHETLYSDYFNYLGGFGQHSVPPERAAKFTTLNYLGLGFSLCFIFVLVAAFRDSVLYMVTRFRTFSNSRRFFPFFLLALMVSFFFQFLFYIHQYADRVNIHAGYLYPAIFSLFLLTGYYLGNLKGRFAWVKRYGGRFLIGLSAIYVFVSAITFWL